jgi:hypothetical protein
MTDARHILPQLATWDEPQNSRIWLAMKTILIQLDTDPIPSSFDRVVAVDAGADEIFSYAGVTAQNVEPLVHGAIFTRAVPELSNTAVFIGGSQVPEGEALLSRVNKTFFGPMRVSVMMDSNGSNTTAAAAVIAARRHMFLANAEALVLAGTGPVGQRAAQILAYEGANVRVASRTLDKAKKTCEAIAAAVSEARLIPVETNSPQSFLAACEGVSLIIAAGAAGVELLPAAAIGRTKSLKVAIDLNAVPPAGINGIAVTDKAVEKNGVVCYGAIGVGGTKMKIHKAAVKKLFTANDLVLDTDAIYQIALEVG